MKTIWIAVAAIIPILALSSSCKVKQEQPEEPKPTTRPAPENQQKAMNVLGWPRMKSNEFGCLLEKELGHRDPEFNCQSGEVKDVGDPCKNTDAYYAGPGFPAGKASRVHKLVNEVALEWEHGELREVTLSFTGKIPETDIRRIFSLPAEGAEQPENILSVSIQDCHKDYNCLVVEGFEHMGAGEVDCP